MSDETTPPEPELVSKRQLVLRPPANAVVGTLSSHQLMRIVRFLAEDTERIVFGDHAQDRMEERGIYDGDVYEVLRTGEPKGRILPGNKPGEWKVKIVAKPRGSRQIGVVTIVITDSILFIKTVEWEDK